MSKSSRNKDIGYLIKMVLLMTPLLITPILLMDIGVDLIVAAIILYVIYQLKNYITYSILLRRRLPIRDLFSISLISLIPLLSSLGFLTLIFYFINTPLYPRWLLAIILSMAVCSMWIRAPIEYLTAEKPKNIARFILHVAQPNIGKPITFSILIFITSLTPVIVYFLGGWTTEHNSPIFIPFILTTIHAIANTVTLYIITKRHMQKGDSIRLSKSGMPKIISLVTTATGIILLILDIVLLYLQI